MTNGSEPAHAGTVVLSHHQPAPPDFAYVRARSLAEVFDAIEQYGAGARLLTGGSDLVVRLRLGHARPTAVIDLKHVPELGADIVRHGDTLRIGARAVMADVMTHPDVVRVFPALVEAARVVGSVQIRNRATVVGNVCNASPAADTVPVLLACEARVVTLTRAGAGRTIPLVEFCTAPGRTVLAPGEIVTAIDLPLPRAAQGSAFARLTRRRGVDLAVVNAAVVVSADGTTRVALGAVAPTVLIVTDETGHLARPDAATADREAAIARIAAHARPRSDVRGAADYRAAMVTVLVRRALAVAHHRLRASLQEGR